MFGYGDETPYRIYSSKQNFEKNFDLLLLPNSENSHYVLKILKDLRLIKQNLANKY